MSRMLNLLLFAQYGLGPIMEDLGVKLEEEMKPGSFVLSNVFSIPGWHPVSSSDGTHIYIIRNRIKENDQI